jgi:putative heme iron utilization protein
MKRALEIFARERFTCECRAEVVDRESNEWRTVVFAMICPLPDFMLFRLIPNGGLYVRGFGQAFEVSADMKNSERVVGERIGLKTD